MLLENLICWCLFVKSWKRCETNFLCSVIFVAMVLLFVHLWVCTVCVFIYIHILMYIWIYLLYNCSCMYIFGLLENIKQQFKHLWILSIWPLLICSLPIFCVLVFMAFGMLGKWLSQFCKAYFFKTSCICCFKEIVSSDLSSLAL